jgi:(p)ppGpp synthase/HD superfamily hydrolase
MLTQRFDQALAFASNLHRQQIRKGSNVPYVSHLLAVCSLVIENGGDEDQAIAALLHDAAEDQGGAVILAEIRRLYGDAVAEIVTDCTDSWSDPKPAWRRRKELYLESLPAKPARSLLVSLADKVHNARSILFDLRAGGPDIWTRFTGGHDGSLWYYGELARFFSAVMPGPLAEELDRTTAALQEA